MTAPGFETLAKNLSAEEFERFRDWIHRHSGIWLEDSKSDSLRISLVTRATRFGLASYDDYYQMLTTDEVEFRELMNLVTINETSFYRFPAQFTALRDQIIPEILESKPKASHAFRAWSAGCSTGEEPYTIAMTLLDSGLEGLGYRPEVLGTDVSTAALDRARDAVYPRRAVENLEQNVVSRHFDRIQGGWRPTKRVLDMVDLSYHNLIKEPYPLALMANWDLIFCRNVTIYFRVESTRRVVHNFFESLNPGGYLFVGHSETLTNISEEFESVEVGGVFLYRKPRPQRLFAGSTLRSSAESRARVSSAAPSRSRPTVPAEEPVADPSPDTRPPAELLAAAHEALELGEPFEAIALAARVIEAEPENADAFLVAAFGHADTGDFEAAAAEANRALELDPLQATARFILGVIYLRKDERARAIEEFKRTIYIDRDFAVAHFNLGNIYRQQGDIDNALRSYDNALRALASAPDGDWKAFMGGFTPELLAQTCERGIAECKKGRTNG
ncbi:MAG: tetratricopeptide repeat protein [Coriobacteriales bacterium]|nr:tetratricopeptide repeat protein [Coriobacteriales bacterium]